MKIIILFYLFFNLIIYISCYRIIVNYDSIDKYNNTECGGPIDLNDQNIYPPCKSFGDAGIRARNITYTVNQTLTFYVISKQDIKMNRNDYFGSLYGDYSSINVIAVNENLENVKGDSLISLNGLNYIGSYTSSNLVFIGPVNNSITIEGFRFINFYGFDVYNLNTITWINSYPNYINVTFINIWFNYCDLVYIYNIDRIQIYNCTFENLFNKLTFISRKGDCIGCNFINNKLDNLASQSGFLLSIDSEQFTIQNSLFYNNFGFKMLISSITKNLTILNSNTTFNSFNYFLYEKISNDFGAISPYKKNGINHSFNNCIFIDNIINNYFIFYQSINGSLINFNNISIQILNLDKYINNSFTSLIYITEDKNIKYINLNSFKMFYNILNIFNGNSSTINIKNSILPTRGDLIYGLNDTLIIDDKSIYNITLTDYLDSLVPSMSSSQSNISSSLSTSSFNDSSYNSSSEPSIVIESDKGLNQSTIIAIIISVVLFLIIVLITLIILYKKRKTIKQYIKRKKIIQHEENQDRGTNDNVTIDSEGSIYLKNIEKATCD